jgi:hypothetical protein
MAHDLRKELLMPLHIMGQVVKVLLTISSRSCFTLVSEPGAGLLGNMGFA